jgi:hypothetical protein
MCCIGEHSTRFDWIIFFGTWWSCDLAPRISNHSLWTIVPAVQIEEKRRTLGRNGSLILDWEDSEPSALVDSAGLKAVEFRGAGSRGVRDEDAKRSRLAHFPPPFPAPFPILRYFQITTANTHTHTHTRTTTITLVTSYWTGICD